MAAVRGPSESDCDGPAPACLPLRFTTHLIYSLQTLSRNCAACAPPSPLIGRRSPVFVALRCPAAFQPLPPAVTRPRSSLPGPKVSAHGFADCGL